MKNYRNHPVKKASVEELLFELLKRNQAIGSPAKIRFCVPHYDATIGIGDDYTASIYVSNEAIGVLSRMITEKNDLWR